jgi:hypothetical protein
VLEAGESSRLTYQVGGDLQGDISIREIALTCEVDPAEGSTTQYCDQLEAGEPVSDDWEVVHSPAKPFGGRRIGTAGFVKAGPFQVGIRRQSLSQIPNGTDVFRSERTDRERLGRGCVHGVTGG